MEMETDLNNSNKEEKSFFQELIEIFIIVIVIAIPIRIFIAQPFIVSGSSMEPTFETGNYLIVDQLTYKFKNPKRGSIIIFRFPNNESKFLIKRVIGLPGEDLKIDSGEVYTKKSKTRWHKIEIPNLGEEEKDSLKNISTHLKENEFFVMGDNSKFSLDSRSWGTLPSDMIVGRPLIRLFPFSEISFMPGNM